MPSGKDWYGSNWIRRDKRLAIYLRDGMSCVWCGAGVEDGVSLTLDHLEPRSHGGTNESTNLVTACLSCNSKRQDRSMVEFAFAVAGYLGVLTGADIIRFIVKTCHKPIALAQARELIAQRRQAA